MTGVFFFFNDTATTEIYTLSLHDALPISAGPERTLNRAEVDRLDAFATQLALQEEQKAAVEQDVLGAAKEAVLLRRYCEADRKSTRLNSSHANISYAVFCLKKKKNTL